MRDENRYLYRFSPTFLLTFMGFFLVKPFVALLLFRTSFVFSLTTTQMVQYFQKSYCKDLYFTTVALYIHHIWVASIIIKLIGDVEENTGTPKSNS